MNVEDILVNLRNGKYDPQLGELYETSTVQMQRIRYENAIRKFTQQFPQRINSDIAIFSAPGRTEIGGNHLSYR